MKSKKVLKIIKLLEDEYPNIRTSLTYANPFQLMIATMLSANANDKQVNKVTPKLFKQFKTPEDFSRTSTKKIESYIRTIGLWKSKAKNIKKTCQILVKKYNSEVPRTMEDLISLPGIGRKVANVILSTAFGIKSGIAIDTHNRRLINRLELTNSKSQDKIEREMMKIVPRKYWDKFSLLMIAHGRKICTAKKPACDKCRLNKICPSAFKFPYFQK